MKIIKNLINSGNWAEIYKLIKNGDLDPMTIVSGTNTLAHIASINNNKKIIRYCLKEYKEALEKSNDEGDTPVHLLAKYGYTDLLYDCINEYPDFLNLLNNSGENIVNILYDDYDFIKYVVDINIDNDPFIITDSNNDNVWTKCLDKTESEKDKYYKIIKLLLDNNYEIPNYLLSESIKDKKDHLTNLLLDYSNKESINDKDKNFLTPFIYACKNRDYKLMSKLIGLGADINYSGPEGDQNPMIFALSKSDEKMINLLLDNGFNMLQTNRFLDTPLHYALNNNKLSNSIVAKLIYLSDLNKKNVDGLTPLHLLCKNGTWPNYNKILKEKELDIFIENGLGKSPLSYLNNNHIYQFLDLVLDSYTHCLKPLNKKQFDKSDTYKKELKKYIFKTKRSIPIKEDKLIMDSKINIIKGQSLALHGLFNSDILHNVIYTVIILKKYKNVAVPFQHFFKDKKINDKILMENNNLYKTAAEQTVATLVKIYTDNFYELSPYLIVWKSVNCYYINKNLSIYLKKYMMDTSIRFIMLKLTLVITEVATHANILIYDKELNRLERFEPYGLVPYVDSDKLDLILEELSTTLFRKPNIEYVKPEQMGFQILSNDGNQNVKKLGDPSGYCLAWTFWYLEMRVNNPTISQYDILNNTKNSILSQKDKNSINRDQLFINFIRDYAKTLDSMKNNFLLNIGISKQNIYNLVLTDSEHKKVLNKLSLEIKLLL
ncbi:MAG: ankyrin repeat protein [Barrevirus sp.]|uniref:Ankyrin repeat protein n=1 Tax=Barrevirus sp. TaxID=2487763 RepID=A0A3G4ZPP7_9VIRU|nr:MAG: ankyrin repeat protein [Barrevirus sp.]